jgi:hypothetical protein
MFDEFYGGAPLAPPYTLKGVTVLGFAMKADRAKLQKLVCATLNAKTCHGGDVYLPASNVVMVEWLHYEKMRADASPCAVSQDEFLVRFNVKTDGRSEGDSADTRSFVPYIFVDEPWSIVSGREVVGFPKMPGVFAETENLANTGLKTRLSTPVCHCSDGNPTYSPVCFANADLHRPVLAEQDGSDDDDPLTEQDLDQRLGELGKLADPDTAKTGIGLDGDPDFAARAALETAARLEELTRTRYGTVQFRALRSMPSANDLAFWSRCIGTVTPAGRPCLLTKKAWLKVTFPGRNSQSSCNPAVNPTEHFAELLGLEYNTRPYDSTNGLTFSVHPHFWYWLTKLQWTQQVTSEVTCPAQDCASAAHDRSTG